MSSKHNTNLTPIIILLIVIIICMIPTTIMSIAVIIDLAEEDEEEEPFTYKKEKYADNYLSMKAVRKNPKCKFYNSSSKEKYGSCGGYYHKKSSPASKEKYVPICQRYPPGKPSTRRERTNEGYQEQ